LAFNPQTSEVVSLALSLVGLLLTLISKKSIIRFSQVKITHYSITWLIPWLVGILFLMLLMKKIEVYLVIILFSFIYYVLHNRNNGEVGSLKKTLVNGCFLTIKVWPLLIIVGLISSTLLVEFKPQQNVLDLKIENYTNIVTIIITACIIAPITEELIFRGMLYPVLKKLIGVLGACFFSSLLFSLIHFNMLSFFVLFVFSCALTYIYERYNNICIPIISHAFFNALMITVILLSR